jgi:carbon-monoxide dehydrogenase large subunit
VTAVGGAGRFVGRSVPRTEDPRLVCGDGEFVADVVLPGMLHATFVRSPHARAYVRSIDTSEAMRVPGVVAVLTGADLNPLARDMRTMYEVESGDPRWRLTPLTSDEVRHVGDPVAIVLAESRYLAEDGADVVAVDYEPLVPVLDYERAAETDALVHTAMGTNVAAEVASPADPEIDARLAASHVVISETIRQHRQSQAPMECRGVLASWDRGGATLRVWMSTQHAHDARNHFARLTGVGENRVRVTARDVGGGFGQKSHVGREECAVVLAARSVRRPVKWIEDRWENLVAASHARDDEIHVTMGFDASGYITAAAIEYLEDLGAYPVGGPGGTGPFVCMVFPGPYRVPALAFTARSVFTNTLGRGMYRGPWMTETVGREIVLDIAARRLGIDPIDLRRRNVVQPDDEPYTTATGLTYERVSPAATLEQAAALIGYEEFRRVQVASAPHGLRRGIGVSLYIEPSAIGMGVLGTEAATIRIDPSGAVSVLVGTCAHGQSIETTLAQVVAEDLGVDLADVVVHQGDTDVAPFGGGTHGSRTAVIAGGACHTAATRLREKIVAAAAHLLEAAPDDLVLAGGRVSVRGTPARGLALAELAAIAYAHPASLPSGMDAGLEVAARYTAPMFTFSNAAHACICEVEEDTGRVRISRYVVSEDCGRMINPAVVEGQIAGGVVQGIGGVLHEHAAYDDDGNPRATTLLDYLLPTAGDVPAIECGHVVTESATPGGYKGMGEGGAIGAPPAVVNAIADALGIDINAQPLGPADVLAWLERARMQHSRNIEP